MDWAYTGSPLQFNRQKYYKSFKKQYKTKQKKTQKQNKQSIKLYKMLIRTEIQVL